jgi:polyisoprenoid-binding protein YceI
MLLPVVAAFGQSKPQRQLPLSPSNTTIAFTLDSTWHTVHGKANKFSGSVHGDQSWALPSLSGTVSIAVPNLDTDNSMRDKKMQQVMHASEHPTILFTFQGGHGDCSTTSAEGCRGEIPGTLTISNTSHPVVLAVEYHNQQGRLTVDGSTTLRWADFGVEDPSILIARVDPEITIAITVNAL